MLALAITRLIEIIGEASRQISEHLKMQHPEIPWREMAGARNRIIHRYFEVDLDIVWQITQHDVPALVPHVQAVLASLS